VRKLLLTWLLNGCSLPITAELVNQFIPRSFNLQDWRVTVTAAFLLATVNTFIRPVLKFLTFPLTFFTLGLWALVLNVLVLVGVDWALPGFNIQGPIALVGGTLLLSMVSALLNGLFNRG
jgi:putative membrane protein